MSEKANPKLIVGCLEVVGADGEGAIPFDEAVIHIEGDEDAEIRVLCAGALRLAPLIVKAVNSHDALVMALEDARRDMLALKSRSDTGSLRNRQIEASAARIESALPLALSSNDGGGAQS